MTEVIVETMTVTIAYPVQVTHINKLAVEGQCLQFYYSIYFPNSIFVIVDEKEYALSLADLDRIVAGANILRHNPKELPNG